MFNTSNEYKKYIKKEIREMDLELIITTNKGTSFTLGRNDIVKNSFTINNQCSDNQELKIGGVYVGDLSVTILKNIDRYSLYNGTIQPYFKLRLSNGWETVPLGVFNISEPNKRITTIEITAYDNMVKFDKDLSDTSSIGTPYDLLMFCCEKCGVELANTQDEIEGMPNGKSSFSIYEDNDISTYRDLLFYIAQVLGGFVTADRYGKLVIRRFGKESVTTFKGNHRLDSMFSDFVTRYTAVSATNVKENLSKYYALEQDDGLTMNLGINPLLQYGTEKFLETTIRNILDEISLIQYVPFSCTCICDPSLDLGDAIQFDDFHADPTQLTCFASYSFTFNGSFDISCPGKDPALANAKSKNDKNIANLNSQVSKNEIVVYNFTNAKEIDISTTKQEIISIAYVTKSKATAQFNAEVLFELLGEVNDDVTFTYQVDSEDITTHQPIQTVFPGKHFKTLYYAVTDVKENSTHTFRVFMQTLAQSIKIPRFGIVATITGQGLVSSVVPWDGTIKFEEEVDYLSAVKTDVQIQPFTASVSTSSVIIDSHSFTERVGVLDPTVKEVEILDFASHYDLKLLVVSNTISTQSDDLKSYNYNQYYIDDSNGFVLRNEYVLSSVEIPMDSGICKVVHINTEQFKVVTSIEEKF